MSPIEWILVMLILISGGVTLWTLIVDQKGVIKKWNLLIYFQVSVDFRLGMESVGHECIGFCEIDKFARESYKSIFQTEGEIEFHDIRDVSDDEFKKLRGKVDIVCGGFPCQAFSIAGRRLGFEDTRGTLFFEIARAAKQIRTVHKIEWLIQQTMDFWWTSIPQHVSIMTSIIKTSC